MFQHVSSIESNSVPESNKLHCAKIYMKIRMYTEPVTVRADATI